MTYEELLKNAPSHDSDAFLDYLAEHNKIVFENDQWLVIENFKYHTPEKPWYTAFHKPVQKAAMIEGVRYDVDWYNDIDVLVYEEDWINWEWLKKSSGEQTIKRFHIHIHK